MAGTIIADYIRTDASQLSINVGNLTFATINASGFFSNTGTQLIAANGQISGASVIASSITNAKLSLSANDSNIKTALNASGDPGIYACRAWVNFNGTSTVAIRGSGNVSSITDNGTGDYTINFTTAMSDANYSSVVSGGNKNSGYTVGTSEASAPTSSSFRVLNSYPGVAVQDANYVFAAVFR